MKLLEFEKIREDGKPYDEDQPFDWFVQFETQREKDLYEEAIKYYHKVPRDNENYEYFTGYGAGMIRVLLTMGLDQYMTDDDIYYYFMPEEKVPEVGDAFRLDGDIWERTA